MDTKTPKQVEQELQQLLEQYKLVAKYFPRVKKIEELSRIVKIFTDAWNYFPHKALQGKSPQQMFKVLYSDEDKQSDFKNQKMPKMIVGGQEMDWDDYWAMIKEMEKAQIPFKNWIEKDLLPKYQIFLSQKYQKYTLNKHLEVADHFFHRVLHVGFITLEEIRKDFIQKEFPRWWQTHVLTDSLSEKEIISSLKMLFEFIELVYGINQDKFVQKNQK